PGIIVATRMFGHIQDSQNRTAYLYEFDGDIPGDDNIGSYHGSEMWFAYDSLSRCDRPFTGKHYDLARQVSSYWTNFIKTGDPNGTDTAGYELPKWEKFTKENDFVMLLKENPAKSPEVTSDHMKAVIKEKTGIEV
ncbi:MAG: carboxylesterase family protein, partial [Butyrivibrio sp.]|uniref:carboxylesterase family protein n=1 Tax=Butyrivibrio sp. TaxID=28121 RepID=UPI0025DD9BAD